MALEEVQIWLDSIRANHPDFETGPPAPLEAVVLAEAVLGPLPAELRQIYTIANGLSCRSFRLFPVFVEHSKKKTWDSLQRANAPDTADALAGDESLLKQFIVFADIGNGFALFHRQTGSIWFEEQQSDEIRETDLGFRDFVELMVENAE